MNFNNYKLMDLHNHSNYSDGVNTIEEIVQSAIDNKLDVIGITDHFATNKCNSITEQNLDEYINKIKSLKEMHKNKIDILCGVEISFNNELCNLEKLPFDKLKELDYILLEYVNLKDLSLLNKYIDKFPCKVGLAHTDLFSFINILNYRKILSYLNKYNIFWEINVNGGYDYYYKILSKVSDLKTKYIFNKLKKFNIEISVGSDIHNLNFFDIENLEIANCFAKFNLVQYFRYDFSVNRLTSHLKF